jgi:hypothetical protein
MKGTTSVQSTVLTTLLSRALAVMSVLLLVSLASCGKGEVAPATEVAAEAEAEAAAAAEPRVEAAAIALAPPTTIQVGLCQGSEDDCQPCSVGSVEGLSFRTPGGGSATRQTVQCSKGSAPRCQDQARIGWRFNLPPNRYYRVEFAYDPDTAKYTEDPNRPFADVYGATTLNVEGPSFTVLSQAPSEAGRTWPYSVHVYDTSDGEETLLACADPEILIDP